MRPCEGRPTTPTPREYEWELAHRPPNNPPLTTVCLREAAARNTETYRHRPPHAGTTTWLECLEEEVLRVGSREKGRTFGSRLASKVGDERAQVASRSPENTP